MRSGAIAPVERGGVVADGVGTPVSVNVASCVPAGIAVPSVETSELATGKSGDWTTTAVLVAVAVLLVGSLGARPPPVSVMLTVTEKPAFSSR